MFSLRLASYLLVAPTLMGIFVIVLLTMNMGSAINISLAAVAGAIVGVPAAWFVAKLIDQEINKSRKPQA